MAKRRTKAEIEADRELDRIAAETAAMQQSPEYQARQNAELAEMAKAWRGDMPVSRAAQLLGMSKRTLEGIEQGRGFTYPILLIHTLRAFGSAE